MGAREAVARVLRPVRQEPDAGLVRRVLAGERECYSTLVRRHQAALFRHARGMGLDYDTAQDLVQDAFVKAYTRLADCNDPDRFHTWVFRILRNLCLDYLKNVRRRDISLEALGGDDIPAGDAGRAELRGALAGAFDRLPPALRDAFLLKHHAGYTYDEMAEIAGATVSAMKMRVHRAREALRSLLVEEDTLVG